MEEKKSVGKRKIKGQWNFYLFYPIGAGKLDGGVEFSASAR